MPLERSAYIKAERIIFDRLVAKEIEKNIEELTGHKVSVDILLKQQMSPENIITHFTANKVVTAIFSKISFSHEMFIIIFLSIEQACELVRILLAQAGLEFNGEEVIDALREFGNIMFGTMASYISKIKKERVDYLIPNVIIDYDIAILDSIILPLTVNKDLIDLYEVNVASDDNIKTRFKMLILPTW